MEDTLNNSSLMIYIPLAAVFVYWLYRYYINIWMKKRNFDDYYNEILSSDKYKVKGRSE